MYVGQTAMEIAAKELEELIESANTNMKSIPGPVYNVKGYGAKGDGVTDDTQAIQEAINDAYENNGGVVYFPSGKYITSAPLIIYNKTYLIGENHNNVIIEASDNFAGSSIIQSYRFDELRGTNKWFVRDGVTHGFTIQDMQVDGKKLNIKGMEVYAKRYFIYRVFIKNCGNGGFYSEAGDTGGQQSWEDMPEGNIDLLFIRECGNISFEFNGGHDMTIGKVFIRNAFTDRSGTIGAKLGYKPDVYNGVSDCQMFHIYGHEIGFISETGAKIDLLISESCVKKAVIINGSYNHISKLEMYNNGNNYDGGVGLEINGENNTLSDVECSISNNSINPLGIVINGARNIITCNVAGNNVNNAVGLMLKGSHNDIRGVIRALDGGTGFVFGDVEGTGYSYNKVSLNITNASLFFNYLSNGNGNIFSLNGSSNNSSHIPFDGIRPSRGGNGSIYFYFVISGNVYTNKQKFHAFQSIDLSSSSIQFVTVNHNCPYQPYLEDVLVTMSRDSTVNDFSIDFIEVESVSTTQINVKVKLGSASSETGAKANLSVHLT